MKEIEKRGDSKPINSKDPNIRERGNSESSNLKNTTSEKIIPPSDLPKIKK